MKAKKMLKMILKDWKHWIGWGLTTGALIGVFYLLPSSVMENLWFIGIIAFAVIVSVDIIKHLTKLQ